MDQVLPYVLAVVPSIGVGFLFYLVIKAIIEGDRKERLAQSRWEAAQATEAEGAHLSTRPGDAVGPAATASTTSTSPDSGTHPTRP